MDVEMRALEFQREQAERERERQFELKIFELELAAKCTQPSPSIAPSFDITKHVRMVPPFSEREVDRYFPYFERVATTLKWPKETWTLLLQSVLVGRARDVYVSLPIEQSLLYETVKSEILRRYELVPEAYRQRFRYCKKTDRHTYVEFAHQKMYLFGRWCTSQKADSMELLRELILLEDFKKSVPVAVAKYLNEQRVATLAQASVLADEFVLTHRGMQENRYGGDQRVYRPPVKGRLRPRVTGPNTVSLPRLHKGSPDVKTEMVCFYCKKSGHKISECQALKIKKLKSVGCEKARKVKVQVNLQSQVDRLNISLQKRDKTSADKNLQIKAQQTQVVQLEETLSLLQEQGTALEAGLVEKDTMLKKQAEECSSLQTELRQQKDYVLRLKSESET